ncbi:hypothetical protein SQ03_29530, partial [Methylobacterium platani JCM 14648]
MTDQTARTPSSPERVLIFDTTLRDGEQCPGATMTLEEKLAVAEMLDAMGVDIIEAGFPIASNGDFEAVAEIARRAKRAVIAGLARAIPADIARAGEAGRGVAVVAPPVTGLAGETTPAAPGIARAIRAVPARPRGGGGGPAGVRPGGAGGVGTPPGRGAPRR